MKVKKSITAICFLVGTCLLASCVNRVPIKRDFSIKLLSQKELIETLFNGKDLIKVSAENVRNSLQSKSTAVSVGWFGFDEKDSTKFIEAAFESGAEFVLFPKMLKPWRTGPLNVPGNITVVFEEGSVIEAAVEHFHGPNEILFTIYQVENAHFLGYGATVRMDKQYLIENFPKSEGRHSFSIYKSRDVIFEGFTIAGSGGDGVYISGIDPLAENIQLRDLSILDHYRQGISIVSAKDVLIENCEIALTNGTLPQAGIDLESNHPHEVFQNIRIINNHITGNSGFGLQIYLVKSTVNTPPIDVYIAGNTIMGNVMSIMISGTENGVRGRVQLVENNIVGPQYINTRDVEILEN